MHLRPANAQDQTDLALFLQSAQYKHRHLDWRSSLDWLGHAPYWLALDERTGSIRAALACPPDIPDHTWLRFFGACDYPVLQPGFIQLFAQACTQLPAGITVSGVGLNPWFSDLLAENGFSIHQHIVILDWNGHFAPARAAQEMISIRPMVEEDLDEVYTIDNLSFEPLWRNSRDEILRSLLQSSYATVAESGGQILGYQISTGSFFAAHLARLAVHPNSQRLSIGAQLVDDLQHHFLRIGTDRLTVNTQHDNAASLTLYHKLGFELTGEAFPIYSKTL